jgi:para-aminobenzoate synthetase component I
LKSIIEKFEISNIEKFKQQMLSWANQFNICCFLDNNNYSSSYNSFESIVAIADEINFTSNQNSDVLNSFSNFIENSNDWVFGHFSYDFKNFIFPFTSENIDGIEAPEVSLFIPNIVVEIKEKIVTIYSKKINPLNIFKAIDKFEIQQFQSSNEKIIIESRFSKTEYCNTINQLKEHIQQGDCYEINFCQEFFAKEVEINPLKIYQELNSISPNPFSSFYKLHHIYLLGASPERFIKKIGDKIISQPIKGTVKRNLENSEKDAFLKLQLQQSEKEKSENVMIVDLVRNDLSKIAKRNSVTVDELFGIYTFPQLFQMISTISATLRDNVNLVDILKALFPMGSMTGAPKYKVMQLIEQYEKSKRGLYSGSVGYINPNKDFDFNVVIRSIAYNEEKKYLSYQVGSAITSKSNAADEYEECLLKAKAIEKVLKK